MMPRSDSRRYRSLRTLMSDTPSGGQKTMSTSPACGLPRRNLLHQTNLRGALEVDRHTLRRWYVRTLT